MLTVADADYPAVDESLLNSIPPATKVVRTRIFEPYDIYRRFTGKKAGAAVDVENIPSGKKNGVAESIAEFIRSTFFVPDARVGWLLYALPAALELVEKEKIDIIYSSSPPYTSALIAMKLKKKTAKPWVFGLRDPWTGFISSPQRWFLPKWIDRSMEKSSVESADAIEIAWEGIGKDLRGKYPDLDSSKIIYVPNGFDSEDYPEEPQPKDARFSVTYTGSLYGRRNPSTLLDAVKRMRAAGTISPENFKIVFAGRFGAEVRAMFAEKELEGLVDVRGYLPHEQSIGLLLRADLLALIVDDSSLSDEIVPGKVFEYIGARRPIIAFATEGAAARIIRDTGTGLIVAPGDVDAAVSALSSLIAHKVRGEKLDFFSPREWVIKEFERAEAARKLSDIFNRILERKR